MQFRVVRVRLWVVPVEFLIALPNLIAIPVKDGREAMVNKPFAHDDTNLVFEVQFSDDTG